MTLLRLTESSHGPVFIVKVHAILCLHGKAQKLVLTNPTEMLKTKTVATVYVFPVDEQTVGRQHAAGGQISDCSH